MNSSSSAFHGDASSGSGKPSFSAWSPEGLVAQGRGLIAENHLELLLYQNSVENTKLYLQEYPGVEPGVCHNMLDLGPKIGTAATK